MTVDAEHANSWLCTKPLFTQPFISVAETETEISGTDRIVTEAASICGSCALTEYCKDQAESWVSGEITELYIYTPVVLGGMLLTENGIRKVEKVNTDVLVSEFSHPSASKNDSDSQVTETKNENTEKFISQASIGDIQASKESSQNESMSPRQKSSITRSKSKKPRQTRDTVIPAMDTMSKYLNEIGKIDLLTKEDEVALGQAMLSGRAAIERLRAITELDQQLAIELQKQVEAGEAARNRMITANLRLVVSIARRYPKFTGVSLMDNIQEGNIGLFRAVDKFDHTKGFKFSTYASWWIRQAISRGLANHSRTIRLPVHMNDKLRLLSERTSVLTATMGREPSIKELATDMNLNIESIELLQNIGQQPLSLSEPIGEEGDGEFGDLLPDSSLESMDDEIDKLLTKKTIDTLLDFVVDERDRSVIIHRFGLFGESSKTLDELSQMYGVSREMIRKIEIRAKKRMRDNAHRI